jgi:hypothetical protein
MPWPEKGIYGIPPILRDVKVYLGKYKWFDHICANHPELHDCLRDVVMAITEPEAIYLDRGTHLSYRFSQKRGKFIWVVYHIVGRTGKVKTAYTSMTPWVEASDLGLNRLYPK